MVDSGYRLDAVRSKADWVVAEETLSRCMIYPNSPANSIACFLAEDLEEVVSLHLDVDGIDLSKVEGVGEELA